MRQPSVKKLNYCFEVPPNQQLDGGSLRTLVNTRPPDHGQRAKRAAVRLPKLCDRPNGARSHFAWQQPQQIQTGDWILGPVPITTLPRSASAVLPRAEEKTSWVFCYRSTRDCSAECGSLSLAGLESGVSQPAFWLLSNISTARLTKSCMLRFAFAGYSNAM